MPSDKRLLCKACGERHWLREPHVYTNVTASVVDVTSTIQQEQHRPTTEPMAAPLHGTAQVGQVSTGIGSRTVENRESAPTETIVTTNVTTNVTRGFGTGAGRKPSGLTHAQRQKSYRERTGA